MKNRASAVIVFLLGTFIITPALWAGPPPPRMPKTLPFQGAVGGRDISESAWPNWQSPVGTVDPGRLIPDDTTNFMGGDGLELSPSGPFKAVSLPMTKSVSGGTPIQVEPTKPIEQLETEHPSLANQPPAPMLATAAPKAKSDSKRIITVAVISVVILAYRKFRRANAKSHPPKPSFL